jgi:hypothetical protein
MKPLSLVGGAGGGWSGEFMSTITARDSALTNRMYLIIIILINVLNRIRATAGQRSELKNLQVVTEITAAE